MWLLRRGWSYTLGLLDQISGRISSERFLYNGYGDKALYARATAFLEDVGANTTTIPPAELTRCDDDDDVSGSNFYSFPSPAAPFLPPESHSALIELVLPPSAGEMDVETALGAFPLAILTPMTGDTSTKLRKTKYASILAQHGVASAIIVPPYYRSRRPPSLPGKYGVPTVSAMLGQAVGVISEALAIAAAARSHGCPAVVYAGVSWGGAMASMSALLDDADHGVVSTVGSHSPAPAFDLGILSRSVDRSVMDQEAFDALWAISHENFVNGRCTNRIVRHLFAEDDHYIPRDSSDKLFNFLAAANGTVNATSTPLAGGHATTVLFHSSTHSSAILDCFSHLHPSSPSQSSE